MLKDNFFAFRTALKKLKQKKAKVKEESSQEKEKPVP